MHPAAARAAWAARVARVERVERAVELRVPVVVSANAENAEETAERRGGARRAMEAEKMRRVLARAGKSAGSSAVQRGRRGRSTTPI